MSLCPHAVAYLNDAFENGDDREILMALNTVARAKGMAAVAAYAGVGRESLYKSRSEGGSPEFSAVMQVMKALGVNIGVKVIAA